MALDTTTSRWFSPDSGSGRRTTHRVAGGAAWLLSASALLAAPAAPDTGVPAGGYRIETEETHRGDLYIVRGVTTVDGTQDGDLYLLGDRLEVAGSVTGDVTAAVRSAVLTGTFGDTVRVWSFGDLRFDGIVDGDLFVFGENVTLGPHSRVTGSLHAGGSRVEVYGTVHEGLEITGGEIVLGALVGRSARVRGDTVRVEPTAAIAGDLAYEAKVPVPAGALDRVGGEVTFGERRVEVERRNEVFRRLLRGVVFFLASVVTGIALIAGFRRFTERAGRAIATTALSCAGMGFIAVVAVPAAALLTAALVIGIPVALIVAAAWLAGLYLARVPVATWIGRRILSIAGRSEPSPYLALVLGLVGLHVGFSLPWIGWLVRIATALVGLGALILASRPVPEVEHAG